MTRHCGRLAPHDPHHWSTRYMGRDQPSREFWCSGYIVTEGGWSKCPGCLTCGVPHPVGGDECRETAREKAISQGDE